MIKTLCIFCGEQLGLDSEFVNEIKLIASVLANYHIQVLCGGGETGIMKLIFDEFNKFNIKVIAVTTAALPRIAKYQNEIHTLTMGSRKEMMIANSDLFLILPGGFGTLDEAFEVITLKRISIINKPIFIFNYKNFYLNLLKHIEHLQQSNFANHDEWYVVCNTSDELIFEIGKCL